MKSMRDRIYEMGLVTVASLFAAAVVEAAPLPADVTLDDLLPENGGDGSVGFVVRGNADSTRLEMVASAGDVNGDGTQDFMVGTEYDIAAGDSRGITYVIFGGAGVFGSEFEETDLLAANGGDGSAGFVIAGAASGDNLAPLDALDLNGDGYDDLLLGSGGDIAATGDDDELYVVYGRAEFEAEFDLASLAPANGGNGSDGIIIKGGGRRGFRAGDINNDLRDDLAVHDLFADVNGANSGALWLVYGRTAGLGPIVDLTAIDPANGGTGFAGFQLVGQPGDKLGTGAAAAGDFNGDLFDDLIIGSPFRDLPGAADTGAGYIFFGGGNIPAETVISDLEMTNGGDGSRGIAVIGEAATATFSRSVGGIGDINNDGFDDVLMSGVSVDFSPPYYQRLVVIFGDDSSLPAETLVTDIVSGTASIGADLPLSDIDTAEYGVMRSAGDPNNDGFDDFLVNVWHVQGGEVLGTYLVYGKSDFPDGLVLTDLAANNGGDGSRGVRFMTNPGFSEVGRGSRGLGDINGDQIDDIVIPEAFSPTNDFRGRLFFYAGPTRAADSDSDGIIDTADNCTLAANPTQTDSDLDSYGNACDPDLNNDCIVNFGDLSLFADVFFTDFEPADFDGSGLVNFADLSVMRELFFGPPGPSGTLDVCATGQ